MKKLIVLWALVVAVITSDTDDWVSLRVKFGQFGLLSKMANQAFFDIPHEISHADRTGWKPIENSNKLGLQSMAWKGTDYRIIPMYDIHGWIAGVQISVSKSDFDSTSPKNFDPIALGVYEEKTVDKTPVYASTALFVDPKTLKKGGRTSGKLVGEGLWIKNETGYTRIPLKVKDIEEEGIYTKQSCIPFMGNHYFHNVTEKTDCDRQVPYFLLTDKDSITGFGWQTFGKTSHQIRDWWDHVDRLAVKLILPGANECMADYTDIYNVISVHFYFTAYPWLITCLI